MIYQVIREADAGRLSWGYHKELLCGIFFMLSRIGDSKSYRIVINYGKSLDRPIPLGAIKFIASQLSSFQDLEIRELLDLAKDKSHIKSAFGVVCLSVLLIENKLSPEELEEFQGIIDFYLNSVYFMDNYIESIKEHIEDMKEGSLSMNMDELDDLFS